MKQSGTTKTKTPVPAFSTEDEEARWWFKNRRRHAEQLPGAVREGQAVRLTPERLLERVSRAAKKTPVVALRIPEADLALARKQSEREGLTCLAYLKSLLHKTLTAREKRASRR